MMSEGGVPLESNQTGSLQTEPKESLPKAFAGSELIRLVDAQREQNGFSGVLFTDIDNTFYRKDRSAASNELTEKAKENRVPIVAITGNNLAILEQRIRSGELPYFQAIAGAVGTEVYVLHVDANGVKRYEKDEDFERRMLSKSFDRVELNKSANEMVDNFKTSHSDWALVFQKPEVEEAYMRGEKVDVQPFKISFHAFVSSKEEVNRMQSEISSRFPNEKVVICEEINYNDAHPNEARKKYAIDILPVTKADVVNYISEAAKVDVEVVAGDSGNDKVMLTGSGDVAIVVGGSRPELKEAIQESSKGTSFRKEISPDGKTKLYYTEKGERLGPESILRAAEILFRAQRRFKPQSSNVSS